MSSSPDRPDGSSDDRFDELEAGLRALGETLYVPTPPPDATARAIRARLEALEGQDAPSHRRGLSPRVRLSPRKAVAAVAVFLAVLIGATPQGRAAVVSVLRFAGVEIRVGDPGPLPTGVPSPLPSERRVTLDEARRTAEFPVTVPAALGDPADVRVADGGRVVTLLWPGIRLDEYDGTLTVVFRKELGEPWPEEVPAIRGWWIQQPHGVSYLPMNGDPPSEERVAGPTLIWQRGRVGLRLEGADREQAVQIANSTR